MFIDAVFFLGLSSEVIVLAVETFWGFKITAYAPGEQISSVTLTITSALRITTSELHQAELLSIIFRGRTYTAGHLTDVRERF